VSAPQWREQPIGRRHDRAGLRLRLARAERLSPTLRPTEHESGGAKTFVAVPPDEPRCILGYCAISPGAVELARVPAAITRKLGHYEVPVFRLGRLTVSAAMQGQRVGSALLFAAGRRAIAVAAEVGGIALAIDAKNERAAAWYERFGALRLMDDPLRLLLPLATIADAAPIRGKS
jgi:GNAT superfamily N-acetyltransferase